MSNWYLLNETKQLSAAENMARDEYLFHLCHNLKIGFFRLYTWSNPSFSFGISQKITKALNLEYIEKNGFSYVRRVTGGKAVLHNDEITYAVISSEDIFYKEHDLYQSYMLIAKVLIAAFKRLGLDASLSAGSPAKLSKSNNPCFSFPTPNEIEIAGKKIIGSAQKRDNTALLQHGSIPMNMDYELYAQGTNSQAEFIAKSMTTLNRVCIKSSQDLKIALIKSFQSFIGSELQGFEFNNNQKHEIAKLEEKYASKEWNFSRS
jgi:lipoate-protein ligase A